MNGAKDAADLPVTGNLRGNSPAAGPLLALTDRQFIDVSQLEDLRSIETSLRAISTQDCRIVPTESCPAVVVRPINGLGPCISAFDRQAMTELTIDRHLKRVVISTQESLPKQSTRCQIAKLGLVVGLPSCSTATCRGGVKVQVCKLMNRLCTNVSYRNKEVSRQFAFDDEVPRFNIASLQFARSNAAFQGLGRQRDGPAADVRAANLRDARRKRPRRGKARGTSKVRTNSQGIEST